MLPATVWGPLGPSFWPTAAEAQGAVALSRPICTSGQMVRKALEPNDHPAVDSPQSLLTTGGGCLWMGQQATRLVMAHHATHTAGPEGQ